MSGYSALALEYRPVPDGITLVEKPSTNARLDEAIQEALARRDSSERRG
jgi:hypothetical protein